MVGELDEPALCWCGQHYVTEDFTHEDWAEEIKERNDN